jgi:hypothetical protein
MLTEQAEWCGGLACFHRQTREYGHLLANLYRHQPRASPHTVSATASVPPRKASLCWSQNENDLGHVWTAPPWQELSDWLQHWSGAVMCPACLCGDKAAGHNALRGSGPNQKHAFKDALTQAGSPDPRIDLFCITSSVLANSFKTSNAVSSLPGLTSLNRSGFDANDAGQTRTLRPRPSGSRISVGRSTPAKASRVGLAHEDENALRLSHRHLGPAAASVEHVRPLRAGRWRGSC